MNDADRLANVFENEANWVAHRCQLHSCGATCVKYSFKEKDQTRKKHPCRFKAPWALREKTEFTPDGLLHIKRNHSRINNYNKALAVALRHNHDVRLLVTNAASLAMCYYASNYATKLDTPLWKRAALMKTVREGMSADVGGQEQMGHEEGGTQRAAQVNNKARQFLARTANQIFTSRELSAVEVCSRLLGHPNHYSSVERWQNIHLNTLYWAVFRRWPGLQAAAGSEIRLREAPETISIAQSGVRLPLLEAYVCRGPLLQDLCFYDYATMIQVRRVGKWTNLDKLQYFPFGQDLVDRERWTQELLKGGEQYVPVLTGPFNHDLDKLNPGYYQR